MDAKHECICLALIMFFISAVCLTVALATLPAPAPEPAPERKVCHYEPGLVRTCNPWAEYIPDEPEYDTWEERW